MQHMTCTAASLCALALAAPAAFAQQAEGTFEGKTITLIASTGAGGHHDAMARTMAQYMPRHLPGRPNMIVRNMPGAGHVLATNYMYNQAAADGLTLATVVNSIPMHQALGGDGVQYDARKFGWIGSTGVSNLTVIAWAPSGVKSLRDAQTKDVTLGATGTGSGTFLYPHVMNQTLGTKFKIVMGYKTTQEIDLAKQRGETQGRAGGSYASVLQDHPSLLKEDKILFIAQIGLDKEPKLAHVPLMHELAVNEDDQKLLRFISSPLKVGRPYFAPPGTPPQRLQALRRAFDETMRDKDFVASAEKLQLELIPLNGEELSRVVDDTINSPADLLARAKRAVEPKG